jgi:hypothetical protein
VSDPALDFIYELANKPNEVWKGDGVLVQINRVRGILEQKGSELAQSASLVRIWIERDTVSCKW